VEVAWTVSDNRSGLERLDVQYSLDNQNWIDWMTDSVDTEAIFAAENDGNYTFRVTARDRVGNESQVKKTVEVLDVVKYYTFNGQRVAMRRCAGDDCGEPV
jgi:hypothetical protein